MTISIRTRRDVIVVDPERFLAAARAAAHGQEITGVHDAVHALLDRDGELVPGIDGAGFSRGVGRPGALIDDRPDGLSPAGRIEQIVLEDPEPLQNYGCFPPEDPFALPPVAPDADVEQGDGA
jgi:hypothetical protein